MFVLCVPWYSRQLERLNNMPVMSSSLEWTVVDARFYGFYFYFIYVLCFSLRFAMALPGAVFAVRKENWIKHTLLLRSVRLTKKSQSSGRTVIRRRADKTLISNGVESQQREKERGAGVKIENAKKSQRTAKEREHFRFNIGARCKMFAEKENQHRWRSSRKRSELKELQSKPLRFSSPSIRQASIFRPEREREKINFQRHIKEMPWTRTLQDGEFNWIGSN